jgi:hypothetical protein
MSAILLLPPFHSMRCSRTPLVLEIGLFLIASFSYFLHLRISAPFAAKEVGEYRFNEETMLRSLRPGTERKTESMTVSTKKTLITSIPIVAGGGIEKNAEFLLEWHYNLTFSLRPTS